MLILLAFRRMPVYREYLLAAVAREQQVWMFSDREPTWESAYLAGHTVLDLDDLDALVAAATPVRPAGLLAWDDTLVVQTARLAQRLGLPTSTPEAVQLCRDKQGTRQALRAAGVPQPESVLVTSLPQARQAAAELGYPLVFKPRGLFASIGVVRVDSADQLASRFRVARGARTDGSSEVPGAEVLVEQYLDGPEVSVDAAWLDGEPAVGFMARKQTDFPPYFEEVGHLVRADDPLLADPGLLGVLRAAHAAVGYTTGWTHTELRLTPDGPKVVEINARVGGDRIPDLARLALGVNIGRAVADAACGRRPDFEPTELPRSRRCASSIPNATASCARSRSTPAPCPARSTVPCRWCCPDTSCGCRPTGISPAGMPWSPRSPTPTPTAWPGWTRPPPRSG